MPLLDVRIDHLKMVEDILQQYVPERDVWAFGSRAKWLAKEYSDLDLCILGEKPLSFSTLGLLEEAFEDSNLPYKVDIVDWATTSESFRQIIEKDKVVVQKGKRGVMGSEWGDSQLSDFINIKHGFAFKGEFFKDSETADCLMTPGNFAVGGGFKGDKFKYYSGPVPEDYVLNKDDLVVTMTDLSKEADTLGYSALVPEINGKRLLHNQRVGLVQFKNEELDKTYLYFLLRSREYRHHVVSGATGTTVKHTSPTKIISFEFKKPPKYIQVDIGQFLLRIENKITLNRQLNQTLEHMAQALFKSWFVDFDPVIDNALAAGNPIPDDLQDRAERRQLQLAKADHKPLPENIRKLFPSEFELTESLVWVPQGWVSTSIASAISVNPRVNLSKGKIAKFADMKALPTSGFAITEVIEKEFSGGAKFQQNDVLLARITPCLENGKTGLVDFLSENEAGFGSTEFIVLREKSHIKYPFIACLSRDDNFRKHCVQSMVGSSGRQRVQNACFDSYFMAIPECTEILNLFTSVTLPNFVKMTSCKNEIESLSQLRDTLLPKLISGELRIPEAQAQLEEALA